MAQRQSLRRDPGDLSSSQAVFTHRYITVVPIGMSFALTLTLTTPIPTPTPPPLLRSQRLPDTGVKFLQTLLQVFQHRVSGALSDRLGAEALPVAPPAGGGEAARYVTMLETGHNLRFGLGENIKHAGECFCYLAQGTWEGCLHVAAITRYAHPRTREWWKLALTSRGRGTWAAAVR